MFRSARSTAVDVSAELQQLPTTHTTFQLEGSWFVVGPTGLFVIAAEDGDLDEAAHRAVRRAEEVRSQLALELAWVPFVDAVVATASSDGPMRLPCIAVPLNLLRLAISDGPRTVDDETLARLTRLRLARLA
jgi:hypothetical protein